MLPFIEMKNTTDRVWDEATNVVLNVLFSLLRSQDKSTEMRFAAKWMTRLKTDLKWIGVNWKNHAFSPFLLYSRTVIVQERITKWQEMEVSG